MRTSVFLIIAILVTSGLVAQLRLPALISDNMVLQRNTKVPVWGWASAKEEVQVIFKSKKYKAIAGEKGRWSVMLDPANAGGPYKMQVIGKHDSIVVDNIEVGDVWIASGQSNMEFGIQTEQNAAEAISKATDTLIRMFCVPAASSIEPADDIAKVAQNSKNGKWIVCSPAAMAQKEWAWHGFSAAGYFFAKEIRQSTNVPVGMIGTYKGGTPAEAWTSVEALKQDPSLANYVDLNRKVWDNYEKAKAAYPQQLAKQKEDVQKWYEEVGRDFDKQMAEWQKADTIARNNGQTGPAKPQIARPRPRDPLPPDGGFSSPGNLYNAMIAPLIPYAIKGVIWYQGESNGDNMPEALQYYKLFPLMITSWRKAWRQGDFPFLYVQLAAFKPLAKTPSEGIWPWVREAQLQTLSLPQTGMAVTTDIGDADNIHPINKHDVGLRLALAARHVAYGESITYSGPIYKSMSVSGNKITLRFDHANGGLISKEPGQVLSGFGIAGADKKFVWAKAEIKGNEIIVYSDAVSNPVAVRYNWGDNPPGRLYNQKGLPASPFRTDNWQP